MGLFGPGKDFWEDPDSAWSKDWKTAGDFVSNPNPYIDKAVHDVGVWAGFIPKQVDPGSAGGSLDTGAAEADRERLASLTAQLQQQAATGGGAWEGTLHDATQGAMRTASAIGQSQPGQGYQSALRNIGNAQSGAAQRGAGQHTILRAQSRQGAQDQLSPLLASQGQSDAQQASAQSAANQGITELNNTLAQNANKNFTGATSAGASLGMSQIGKSDGGEVPGKSRVFGDDEQNDTVPAMLSPGEIVIPRTHATSPEAAADFVRALQAKKQGGGSPGHFADGGQTGLQDGAITSDQLAQDVFVPHIGAANFLSSQAGAPTIKNGGLLDVSAYDKNRGAVEDNARQQAVRAAGMGPTVTGQQVQNSADSSIADAMANQGGRGGAAEALTRAIQAQQGAGGNAAEQRMGEQRSGASALAQTMGQQRAQDMALAVAQQQAAFRQTQINAGINLAQQAQIRGILGGAGQAAVAGISSAGGKNAYEGSDLNTPGFDQAGNNGVASQASEWDNPYDSGSVDHGATDFAPDEKWQGGEIEDTRAEDFVRALKRRRAA